jgi:aerobic carbon-monoxide dehydrogenase medium subunit
VASAADALLIKAGIVNAADRHIHIAILRRAIDEAAA